MASTGTNAGGLPTNFMLTPQQQSLLYAALNSNKQPSQSPGNKGLSLSPSTFASSPAQSNAVAGSAIQESPFMDNYDYEFGDSSFDFDFSNDSQSKMIGDLPGSHRSDSTDNDAPEKRSHPDDDGDESGNGAKRRESTEKVPKKPGRKPLTSEPSSKRKAQNRAAQRAFRERKEKHLKDLETKVEELEKASEEANHENALLRAQVDKMTSEINEWKSRFSAANARSLPQTKPNMGFGAPAISTLGDVNFQFEFPKFGILPGPTALSKSTRPSPPSYGLQQRRSTDSTATSPRQQSKEASKSPTSFTGVELQTRDDLAKFSALFSPPSVHSASNASRASLDSAHYSLNHTTTSSPSASSASNVGGPSSSCGTSPEPFTQSPMGFKPVDTLTTIGEEQQQQQQQQQQPLTFASADQGFAQFDNIDFTNFDWLAQQNGGQFDPQLFGDYREPQESILANTTLDDSFFNEALDADFFMPYNVAPNSALPKKTDLIAQIDAAKNADDDLTKPTVKEEAYNCPQLWAKLQDCPQVQTGEFDLDGLCSELQKKAKCSGKGPTITETDFQTVVQKWLGKDGKLAKPTA